MFRRILVVVILCALAIGGLRLQQQINELPVTTQQINLSRLYGEVSPAVVWIGVQDDCYGTLKRQGSGFLVSADGLIATAGHVVEYTESFEVMLQDGTRAVADFVHMENIDICDVGFIKLRDKSDKELPYFKFDTEIKIGEDLIILGYPWGLNNGVTLTKGVVSLSNRNEPFFGTKLVIHVDAASYPGNSGSPVIDMDGEVVGMLIGGRYGNDNFGICTTGRILELALAKYIAFEALENAK